MIALHSLDKPQIRKMLRTDLGLTQREALLFGASLVGTDRVWVGYNDDKLVCVWGAKLGSIANPSAYIWLYTLPEVEDCKFVFVRQSQIVRDQLLVDFPAIHGHCHKDAERSIRWMKLLGATFGEPDGDLIPFQIVRKDG